jgi:hypothetical protein
MSIPQNYTWGPPLWRILHSLSEKVGLLRLRQLPQEESRLWSRLLLQLTTTLPCPTCREHYTEYYRSNNPNVFITQGNFKDSIRNWLYTLHDSVNIRLGKKSIAIQELSHMYSNCIGLLSDINILSSELLLAVRLHWIQRDNMNKLLRLIREIISFYAI